MLPLVLGTVLIDTCIWSLALRRRPGAALNNEERLVLASLKDAIREGRVTIIGPIRQEILSGISDVVQFEKLKTTLAAYPDQPLTTADYEEAARLYNLYRSRGIQAGPVDILLCSVAQRRHWSILTSDRGLKRCIEILSNP